MRIQVYSQEILTAKPPMELDDEHGKVIVLAPITKTGIEGENGQVLTYSAVRQYLASSDRLHDDPDDDDRSAITWWLPKSPERREHLALQFEALADMVRAAPPETGLD